MSAVFLLPAMGRLRGLRPIAPNHTLKGLFEMGHRNQDLTSGNVPGKLLRFALPLFGANLLQSLYSIADMVVVGRFVGKTGLAAISNASMIGFIINSICIGLTMGGTVLAAQYKGAGDEQGQRETVGTLFSVSFIAAILVTAAGLLLYEPVFALLRVPAEAMGDACGYMRILCAGTVFVFGYNAVCALMKGLGDSKSPLYFVAVAAAVNVCLDLLLVGPLGMGTEGAAYATIFSQGVSLVISVVYLRRKEFLFDFKLKSFVVRKDKLAVILKVGLPTAVQMAVVNISYLLITGMLNTFLRHRAEDQHHGRNALLGHRAGGHHHGGAEYGRSKCGPGEENRKERPDFEPGRDICGGGCGSDRFRTFDYAVRPGQRGRGQGRGALPSDLL